MTPEQKQRIDQIRERRAQMYFPSGEATKEWADIDFLLTALDDSVRGHIEVAVDKAVDLGATSMRSRCVEKVKAWADQHKHAFVRDVVAELYAELDAVTLQEQEAKQS